jgi:hypothetical protein
MKVPYRIRNDKELGNDKELEMIKELENGKIKSRPRYNKEQLQLKPQ